jgi:excisionase family DNA binding protein
MSNVNEYQSTNELTPLLRGSDVANILNISRSLAYQLIQRGEIPSIKIGRAVRVRSKDLEDFISNGILSR